MYVYLYISMYAHNIMCIHINIYIGFLRDIFCGRRFFFLLVPNFIARCFYQAFFLGLI